jgi:hypothetical protein
MISTEYITDIFIARCKDTGERPKKEEAILFRKQVNARCKGHLFELRESRIGPLAAAAISKILKTNPAIKRLDLYGNGKFDI